MEKILLSTTSQLNGWDILDYVDVISSQVVIGTGVFSDLFAGVTDFMGGNSSSYEKQLEDISVKFIELDNMLENIIDEDLAYGKVEDLPLKRIKIDKLLNLVDAESSMCVELNEKIFQYYRITGRYSKAEDLLYSMIDKSSYIDKKRLIILVGGFILLILFFFQIFYICYILKNLL